jgi:hypothetical protein
MDPNELAEPSASNPTNEVTPSHGGVMTSPPATSTPAVAPAKPAAGVLPAQDAGPPCPTCGTAGVTANGAYIYALGQIEARCPRPSVEKEMAQATGRAETAGRTD